MKIDIFGKLDISFFDIETEYLDYIFGKKEQDILMTNLEKGFMEITTT